MIDYIKINDLKISVEEIQSRIDFVLKVNQRTGEELFNKKRSAYFKNLVFTITPGDRFVKFQGSLHKYANGGDRNNDRFSFDRFLKVADDLRHFIDPDDQINTIEFGINIETPFDPSDFINNTISHHSQPINKTIKSGMEYSQTEYSHFVLKIYNKGLHQGPKGSFILRIEAKYLKMQKLFPNGLKWADLSNIETWVKLGAVLKKKFSEIIYYDPSINLQKIPARDRAIINQGHNPIYWKELSGSHVSRTRKQYQHLINKYGSTFKNLPELVDIEINEVVKSYHLSETLNESLISGQIPELVKSYPLLYSNFSPFTESTSSGIRFCKVTGIDISCQKEGSTFLCVKGLRNLKEKDPKRYDDLKRERLSLKWDSHSTDEQIREIAHSIRNEFFNEIHNAERDIAKLYRYPSLFDNWSLIRKNKRKFCKRM